MKRLILISTCLLALAACDKPAATTETKPEDPSAKNTTSQPAAQPAQAAQPAAVAIADTDLSTPADFEEAAEKAVTAKTYKAELATLEADVAKD